MIIPQSPCTDSEIQTETACIHAALVITPLMFFSRFASFPDSYETSDGIARQESAELKNAGTDHASLAVHGTIQWVAPDGQQYTVNYVADENGFQPQGVHLPKA